MEIGEAQQINQNAGFRVIRELRLLCLSFFVCLPSGRCSAETANFMFFWCCPYTVQSWLVGWRELKPQARRMQERAAAGWWTSDSASIELFPAVTDFTYFLYERICTSSHRSSMTLRH